MVIKQKTIEERIIRKIVRKVSSCPLSTWLIESTNIEMLVSAASGGRKGCRSHAS